MDNINNIIKIANYLESIQVNDEDFILSALGDNKKRVWIIAYDLDDIYSRFYQNPSEEIQKAYHKFYDLNIDEYSFHFILSSNYDSAKKIIKDLGDFPIIFITENNHFKMPIILNDINLESI